MPLTNLNVMEIMTSTTIASADDPYYDCAYLQHGHTHGRQLVIQRRKWFVREPLRHSKGRTNGDERLLRPRTQ